jgi:FdhD protein
MVAGSRLCHNALVPSRPASKTRLKISRLEGTVLTQQSDLLATEEPLEIRVLVNRKRVWQTVTMRTPGADFELAAGLLFTEGLISTRAAIRRITYCIVRKESGTSLHEDSRHQPRAEQIYNTVNVALNTMPNLEYLDAFRVASSACGVCGKASLEALTALNLQPLESELRFAAGVLFSLPDRLRAAQGVFDATGGLHAAAAFSVRGELLCVREDVGRHNALDKLIGWALLNGVPLEDSVVLVSGRVGFEIAQKCVAARIPVLCAIGAPSSLAVNVSEAYGLTLIGFLRGERANVYCGAERLQGTPALVTKN